MSKDRPNCKELVLGEGCWRSRGCSRYAVRDGYCKQHHPETVAAKNAASKAKQDVWLRQLSLKRKVQAAEQMFKDVFRLYMGEGHRPPCEWAKVVTSWNTLEAARAELKEVQNDE